MNRRSDGLMPRNRTQRARYRWASRALSVLVVALGLYWLGPDDRPGGEVAPFQATAMVAAELHDAPSLFRKALVLSGLTGDAGWADAAYVPSSNQRVLGPEEWSDPKLRIIESDLQQGRRDTVEAQDGQGEAATRHEPRGQGGSTKAAPRRLVRKDGRKTGSLKARRSSDRTRRIRREWFTVTAYCPCKKCCGRWARYHRTASGMPLSYNGGNLVAADTRVLPFHTEVRIPGYAGGRSVPVVDRGAAVQGRMLDVFFPTHWRAKRWGKKRLVVEIVP